MQWDLLEKRLGLLHELVPVAGSIAHLANSTKGRRLRRCSETVCCRGCCRPAQRGGPTPAIDPTWTPLSQRTNCVLQRPLATPCHPWPKEVRCAVRCPAAPKVPLLRLRCAAITRGLDCAGARLRGRPFHLSWSLHFGR